MTTRLIREDDISPYVTINGLVFRPNSKFDASAKKRVGTKVEVKQSASRVYGSMVFLTVPGLKYLWPWAPEKYRDAKPVDPAEFNEKWNALKEELLNSDKPTAEVLLGWMGVDYLTINSKGEKA